MITDAYIAHVRGFVCLVCRVDLSRREQNPSLVQSTIARYRSSISEELQIVFVRADTYTNGLKAANENGLSRLAVVGIFREDARLFSIRRTSIKAFALESLIRKTDFAKPPKG